jgi:hypothetical protein
MELASWLANEPWSDAPEWVSPVIGAFLRGLNDAMDDDDRQRLKPYAWAVLGTRTTPADEETRAWLAVDWLVRVHAPARLRVAGLTEHAQALEGLPRIVDTTRVKAAQPTIESAARASDAAWDTARDAARDAAWGAASDAARDAARAAAWAVAWDTARDAARDAAWGAARDAVRDAVRAAAWAVAWDTARDAARDAAWGAAWDAARDAVSDAARDAAWGAARGAAWDAARDAAWDAARDAARPALRPTVEAVHLSLFALLDEMIAVGRVEVTPRVAAP